MRPRERDEPFVVRADRLEQLELAVSGEQLVIPLHVEEDWHLDFGASSLNRGPMSSVAGMEDAWRIPFLPSTAQRKRSPAAATYGSPKRVPIEKSM